MASTFVGISDFHSNVSTKGKKYICCSLKHTSHKMTIFLWIDWNINNLWFVHCNPIKTHWIVFKYNFLYCSLEMCPYKSFTPKNVKVLQYGFKIDEKFFQKLSWICFCKSFVDQIICFDCFKPKGLWCSTFNVHTLDLFNNGSIFSFKNPIMFCCSSSCKLSPYPCFSQKITKALEISSPPWSDLKF